MSLPEITKDTFADTKNAEAAIKFAQWAQGAEYDQVVAAYAKCHSDPNLDDTFIRTLGQLDRYYLGVFLCNRHDMLRLHYYFHINLRFPLFWQL